MKFKNKYIGLVLAASMAASAEAAVIAARPVVVRA